MKEFLDTLLGTYTPVTNPDGLIPPGLAGVDVAYCIRAVVFLIVLYAVLRILGGLICKM